MKKSLILVISSMVLVFSSPAFASEGDESCGATSGEWMSQDAVKAKVSEKGYEVRRLKREDGCYEAYAITKDGARVELYINPVTGMIVKSKNKS